LTGTQSFAAFGEMIMQKSIAVRLYFELYLSEVQQKANVSPKYWLNRFV